MLLPINYIGHEMLPNYNEKSAVVRGSPHPTQADRMAYEDLIRDIKTSAPKNVSRDDDTRNQNQMNYRRPQTPATLTLNENSQVRQVDSVHQDAIPIEMDKQNTIWQAYKLMHNL